MTNGQWKQIVALIPPADPGGRHRSVNMREVINAVLYLNRSGCSWRMLPHEFPPWGTVHYYYRRFRLDGTWRKIHDRWRERVRVAADKKPTPSAAMIDAQSVKTACKGGREATTGARKSRAESDLSSSIPWG